MTSHFVKSFFSKIKEKYLTFYIYNGYIIICLGGLFHNEIIKKIEY